MEGVYELRLRVLNGGFRVCEIGWLCIFRYTLICLRVGVWSKVEGKLGLFGILFIL